MGELGVPIGEIDVARALESCSDAVSDDPSNHNLQFLLGRTLFASGDVQRGLDAIRAGADAGIPEAQVEAALILFQEAFSDPEEAIGYLEDALTVGNSWAAFELGSRLLVGKDVEMDIDRGLTLLDRAAADGLAEAAEIASLQRQIDTDDAIQAQLRRREELRAEICEISIRLCGRGCEETDGGRMIYNTRDGEHWFTADGRWIPPDTAPNYGCPQ